MDKREQIARMAQTKEDEMLLARVYERMTNAAARSIPASTCFLSKREQMLAAELLRHGLHAVADPEDGNARFKNGLARLVVAFLIGAHVGARENDAFRGEFTNEISRDVVRMNFAVDVGFAHASGDQLGHLAAEVQNQDAVVRHGLECFFCGGD